MDAIAQIIVKSVFTLIMLGVVVFVWTRDIDLQKTVFDPLSSFIKFRKHHGVEITHNDIIAASALGRVGIFFRLQIVNAFEKNITIKHVHLRYSLAGKPYELESHVFLTGLIYSPHEKKDIDSLLIRFPSRSANIINMNWNNLRTEIAKNRLLEPGGVLSGSVAFLFEFSRPEDLLKVKDLEVVVADYSGNETAQRLAVQDTWVSQAKDLLVENRRFMKDQAGAIQYLD